MAKTTTRTETPADAVDAAIGGALLIDAITRARAAAWLLEELKAGGALGVLRHGRPGLDERTGRAVSAQSADEREIHAGLSAIAMNALREALDDTASYSRSAVRRSERRAVRKEAA